MAAKITGYDPHSLENMVYVASRFDISRRREKLSWSHHETLAALEPDEQNSWLDLATERRLSVSDLRIELRTAQRVPKADTGTDAGSVKSSETTDVVVCPQCGFELRPPTIDAKGHDEPGSGDANGHRLT